MERVAQGLHFFLMRAFSFWKGCQQNCLRRVMFLHVIPQNFGGSTFKISDENYQKGNEATSHAPAGAFEDFWCTILKDSGQEDTVGVFAFECLRCVLKNQLKRRRVSWCCHAFVEANSGHLLIAQNTGKPSYPQVFQAALHAASEDIIELSLTVWP